MPPIAHNAAATHTSGATAYFLIGPFPPGSVLTRMDVVHSGTNAQTFTCAPVLGNQRFANASTHTNGRPLIERATQLVNGQNAFQFNAPAASMVTASFGLNGIVTDEAGYVVVSVGVTGAGNSFTTIAISGETVEQQGQFIPPLGPLSGAPVDGSPIPPAGLDFEPLGRPLSGGKLAQAGQAGR